VRLNLCRNLFLHLVNLVDFGLIQPDVVYSNAVQILKLRRRLLAEKGTVELPAGVVVPKPRMSSGVSSVPEMNSVVARVKQFGGTAVVSAAVLSAEVPCTSSGSSA